MPIGRTHRQQTSSDTPDSGVSGHTAETPIYNAMVEALATARDHDRTTDRAAVPQNSHTPPHEPDAMPDVHNGSATEPHALLPDGEVLVALPYKPAFPGLLAPGVTPSATAASPTDSPDAPGGLYAEIALHCRRSVAQWIGVYLTSFYGNAQVRYEWRGEVLAIFDDPWAYPEEHPHLVFPDNNGRYAIIQPWLGISADYRNDLTLRHPNALAILASNQMPGATAAMTSTMTAYLCDHPGAHERQHESLEAAITKLTTT